MRGIYQNLHPFSKIAIVAMTALAGLILFMLLATVLVIPLFGIEVFSDFITSSLHFNESNVHILKYFQLAQSLGLFVIPSIVLAYLFGPNLLQYLRLHLVPEKANMLLVFFIVLISLPFINMVGQWNANMSLPQWLSSIEEWMKASEESAAVLTELFVSTQSIGGLLFNIFLIGVIPAIGEEFLFRGVIQRILHDWTKNKHWAVWITAILFSALHFQFYGFIPRAILGAMFGYMFIWTGNLWLPVIAHFVNNTAAVLAYFFFKNEIMSMDPDAIGTKGTVGIMTALLSFVIVVILFTMLYRRNAESARTKFL